MRASNSFMMVGQSAPSSGIEASAAAFVKNPGSTAERTGCDPAAGAEAPPGTIAVR